MLHFLLSSEKSPKVGLKYSTISGLNGRVKFFLSVNKIFPWLTLSFQSLKAFKESEHNLSLDGRCLDGIIPSTAASASVLLSLIN